MSIDVTQPLTICHSHDHVDTASRGYMDVAMMLIPLPDPANASDTFEQHHEGMPLYDVRRHSGNSSTIPPMRRGTLSTIEVKVGAAALVLFAKPTEKGAYRMKLPNTLKSLEDTEPTLIRRRGVRDAFIGPQDCERVVNAMTQSIW